MTQTMDMQRRKAHIDALSAWHDAVAERLAAQAVLEKAKAAEARAKNILDKADADFREAAGLPRTESNPVDAETLKRMLEKQRPDPYVRQLLESKPGEIRC